MQKWWKTIFMAAIVSVSLLNAGSDVKAAGKDCKIEAGVTVGDIDVSGMTIPEAESAVAAYVDSLQSVPITLRLEGGQDTVGTAG